MGIEIPEGMKTIIEAERLKSRLLGLEDGFSANESEITELKERIATLVAQLTEAREQIERLQNPITTEEAVAAGLPEECSDPDLVNAIHNIILSRAQPRQEQP